MESLREDKERIETIRRLIDKREMVDPDLLLSFTSKYEELVELAEVSFEMIDHLVQKIHTNKSV
ncbi:MAG: hypothetical protein ACFHWX_10585 [Bacteroidota bacterium]